MHDQPKIKQRETNEAKKAREDDERKKGELYQALMADYRAKKFTVDALHENRKLLLEIPEAYTFYNYEREILEHLFKNATEEKKENLDGNGENKTPLEWLREELKLNSAILQKDFKIYAAFVHRHWIFERLASLADEEEASVKRHQVAQGNTATSNDSGEKGSENARDAPQEGEEVSATNKDDSLPMRAEGEERRLYSTFLAKVLEKEKEECERLLLLDERNFHAWNHRRGVFAMLQRPYNILASPLQVHSCSSNMDENSVELFSSSEAAEIRFTKAVICRNFSNYSAWHQRAITLQAALRRHDHSGLLSPEAFSSEIGNDSNSNRIHASSSQKRPAWLPLSDSSETPPKSAISASLRVLSRHLLDHLVQDLDLLVQAIYCDPNDQAAWFYAPFVREVFELYEPFLRPAFVEANAELLKSSTLYSSPTWGMLRGCCGDFVDILVRVTIDILVEERRLGEDDACYLPYHFLLSNFARLFKKAQGEEKEIPITTSKSARKLQSYIAHTSRKVFNYNAVDNEGRRDNANENDHHDKSYYHDQSNEEDGEELNIELMLWCFEQLHAHLVPVDPLRKGMYDDLLAVALKWKTNKGGEKGDV